MSSTAQPREAPNVPASLIVIGGSAGSIEALQTLMAGLPADLNAAILVVVHASPTAPAMLDRVLDRAGPLRALYPHDKQQIKAGNIYVAPPDRHLLVQNGTMRVVFGPRQNRHRPAIDPLFSSTREWDGRTIAIVLSGMLDDGAKGAVMVKQAGGIVIAQSPDEASFASMPINTIRFARPHYVLPVTEMAAVLSALVSTIPDMEAPEQALVEVSDRTEQEEAMHSEPAPIRPVGQARDVRPDTINQFDEPFAMVCPECGGAMILEPPSAPIRFRCFLGHGFTAMSLWYSQIEIAEEYLWRTLRQLEETAYLGHKLMADSQAEVIELTDTQLVGLEEQVAGVERRIEAMREILNNMTPEIKGEVEVDWPGGQRGPHFR